MPAHIFTRVGYWKESVAANRESARELLAEMLLTQNKFADSQRATLQQAKQLAGG